MILNLLENGVDLLAEVLVFILQLANVVILLVHKVCKGTFLVTLSEGIAVPSTANPLVSKLNQVVPRVVPLPGVLQPSTSCKKNQSPKFHKCRSVLPKSP